MKQCYDEMEDLTKEVLNFNQPIEWRNGELIGTFDGFIVGYVCRFMIR